MLFFFVVFIPLTVNCIMQSTMKKKKRKKIKKVLHIHHGRAPHQHEDDDAALQTPTQMPEFDN